jgi:glycosyltransferase involved in cell wall biosynthesis
VRICLVYDCLYPHTIGGAERWYRNLAERLAERGHAVTYLTLRQWPRGEDAGVPGVDVRPVGPKMALYTKGRRRALPAIVFAAGVFWHLLRRGRRYDVVHVGSMPYLPLLAVIAVRRARRFRVFVDWIEVWTREYWREYLGHVAGTAGWRIQQLAACTRHRAFAFARLHAKRLAELGHVGDVTVIDGLYSGGPIGGAAEREPVIVFAGRHIPEKDVPALVPALALARQDVPELRGELYGDGPDRPSVLALIREYELNESVTAPGFVDRDTLQAALARATCVALPSRREGYGLVVVEACAMGTPVVIVAHPDNAAVELVEDGENGIVVDSSDPEALAHALVAVHQAGDELRRSTAEWYRRNARRLSLETSLDRVLAAYRE